MKPTKKLHNKNAATVRHSSRKLTTKAILHLSSAKRIQILFYKECNSIKLLGCGLPWMPITESLRSQVVAENEVHFSNNASGTI